MTSITRIRFDHLPPGEAFLGSRTPRLSWQITAPDDWRQSAAQVRIEQRGVAHVHPVPPDSQHLSWPAAPLESRAEGTVAVRVRGTDGTWSRWSAPAAFRAPLFTSGDWSARFIGPSVHHGPTAPAPRLRRTFTVGPELVRATLYVSALGAYDLTVNGEPSSDRVLAPGWTSYAHRLRYHGDDVTVLLREGENTIDAVLGNGWYRGRLTWHGRRDLYGDRLALLAQLELEYAGGRIERVVTDDSWSARLTTVVADDLYDGATVDHTTAESGPEPVAVVDASLDVLTPAQAPPIRVIRTVPAVEIRTTPSGRLVADFGQNLVGWVRLSVRGPYRGQRITVRHAEVLEHGELATRPLRSAKATDRYVLDGTENAPLEPPFTFHGFRYAEISGVAGLRPTDIEAVVISSDLARTGWFSCDDPMIEKLHENVVWGMRGNFIDVPVDCPQRDERLGWTGDIQVFGPTAMFLGDTAGLLSSWLRDLAADQHEDGTVPFVVPDVLPESREARAAWGDAATIVPWTIYQETGDESVLERQFASMTAWTDRIAELAGDDRLWTGSDQFGDWLDPTAPADDPAAAKADPDVVATAHLARSAWLCAEAARVLGRPEESRYRLLHEEVVAAFNAAWVTADGRIESDAQTVYALALRWNLFSDDRRRRGGGERLARLVHDAGYHMATGFVGTPLVLDALTDAGHAQLAHRLLQQTECPSWLYPVTMGATTIWERWDSLLPDGTVNPGEMTSFNHYALGAVADWLHRRVAGLAPAAPGWKRIEIAPLPGGGISRASASHLSPFGRIDVAWSLDDDVLALTARIPTGTTAQVRLPDGTAPVTLGPGHHTLIGHGTRQEAR
ncbi:family 78 glycoside hydrolase catalytic domain [Streptomyces sp. NPDC058357]|uniref:family 78 glycoside hydrolase catalytic domain n=1 Tax=unclassified Streptomyces TaxID=2593676 RepID=UPI0036609DF9